MNWNSQENTTRPSDSNSAYSRESARERARQNFARSFGLALTMNRQPMQGILVKLTEIDEPDRVGYKAEYREMSEDEQKQLIPPE